MYSVVILTLNEEARLPSCLESVRDCDDVVVLDSGSTDATATIARAAGARVHVNAFQNFAQQRNHAHEHIPFRHPWVFHLDADETLSPELHQECRSWSPDAEYDGAWVAPKMMWRGQWIPRSTDFPAWQARFVQPNRFRFVQSGHGQRESVEMKMTYLQHNYLHDLSAGGVDAWLEKHRRYARAEAEAHHQTPSPNWTSLFASDPLERRRTLKALSYMLPARPVFRFIYQYILKQGFRDGSAGWEYCRLIARYEGFAQRELRRLKTAHGS